MSKNINRILYLDIARTIAVLWIVGYWHLRVYCGNDSTVSYLSFTGDEYITNVILGLFMFLSGFFISKYTFKEFKKDTLAFLYKRMTRFYFLYSISAILLYIIGYNSIFGMRCLIHTLTMTSTYFLPQPRTLWFFSMIASFYIFTPIMMMKPYKSLICTSVIIYSLSILSHILLPQGIDTRLFWCFPLYCMGLYVGKKKTIMKIITRNDAGLFALTIIIAQFYLSINHAQNFILFQYITLPIGVIFILYFSRLIESLPISWFITRISYCSMSAYLFHREIYIGLMELYNYYHLNFSYWLSLITFLPICILISYYIQLFYDNYILPKILFNF